LSLVPVAIEPENIPLSILYEDEDVLIVDKPKGMVVHPAPGHYTGTLVNAILYHCGERLSGINGELRPGIVHRIDKDTTGSLIVCKNDRAHRFIADQIAVHSIRRSYVGIVAGQLKTTSGSIDAPIGRSPKDRKKMAVNVPRAKPAITHYKVLQALDGYTYLQFDLETGRTHQIRVHMASLQHPLIGDPVYGTAKGFASIQGQALHAWKIGFMHPTTRGYVEFEAPIPGYMLDFVKKHPIVSQSSRL
ncbi:MAG: RluA family pseudouridine synthase, partial [Lachnospiraceae bacterium]|nr:RluA family pseudouridine synthase [Lachnospiraceae bacterium]